MSVSRQARRADRQGGRVDSRAVHRGDGALRAVHVYHLDLQGLMGWLMGEGMGEGVRAGRRGVRRGEPNARVLTGCCLADDGQPTAALLPGQGLGDLLARTCEGL